jgi:hypothetical protein
MLAQPAVNTTQGVGMRKKQKKPTPKAIQDYLQRKPRIQCEYTEYGVISYVVPSANGAEGNRRKTTGRSKKAKGEK